MKPKKIGNKTHNIEKLDYVKMRIADARSGRKNKKGRLFYNPLYYRGFRISRSFPI